MKNNIAYYSYYVKKKWKKLCKSCVYKILKKVLIIQKKDQSSFIR